MIQAWPLPAPGDIIWCLFPEVPNIEPGPKQRPTAYALAGLPYDTKFDFKVIVDLPWSERYFKVPARSSHGNTPKLGTLHATILHAIEVAYRAASTR